MEQNTEDLSETFQSFASKLTVSYNKWLYLLMTVFHNC